MISDILWFIAQDVETADQKLPETVEVFLHVVMDVAGTMFTIVYSTPVFLFVFAPLSLFYVLINVGYWSSLFILISPNYPNYLRFLSERI